MNGKAFSNGGKIRSVLTRSYTLPYEQKFSQTITQLSPLEKGIFYFLLSVFIVSFAGLLFSINKLIVVEVPAPGGSLVEGVVGSPRFINPLLAISDADRDLSTLIYSGLLKATPEGGLVPDLAERFVIEEGGLVYRFFIRADARFHDGTLVTADDVLFTISMAQDQSLKSPKRANWDGVVAQRISEREITFTLKQPFSPFLENVTLGILPKHIWEQASVEQFPFSQWNIEPIGSGPYKVGRIRRNSSGIPISYDLSSYSDYTRGAPFISRLTIRFYANEDTLVKAFLHGEIDSVPSLSSERLSELSLKKNHTLLREPLPRIFAVFFNQNKNNIFTRAEVRKALDIVIDRNQIIEEVLGGFGTVSQGPLPTNVAEKTNAEIEISQADRETAAALLEENGWEKEEETGIWIRETKKESKRLSFTLTSSNVPELKAAALLLKKQWETFGAEVVLQLFNTNDLSQNVIRPREYEAIFFGEIVGRELDLFAFWHSSQRNDPGLNIALYANIAADDLLERARTTSDTRERKKLFRAFADEVAQDTPAVFVYSPDFIYIIPKRLQGVSLGAVTTPNERFLNVNEWFTETDTVWTFFKNN